MKYILLLEQVDIINHLKERGIDPFSTRLIIDKDTNNVYFFLYNLSGEMIGYHKYNPENPKKIDPKLDPRLAKYFTWVTEEGNSKKIAVWGLETYDFRDKFIFITEGIFDIARVHEAGYPGICVFCNNPSDSLKSWLNTLPQIKIVLYDNDSAGKKLKKVGDYSFTTNDAKDMNDLTPKEAKKFLDEIVDSIFTSN